LKGAAWATNQVFQLFTGLVLLHLQLEGFTRKRQYHNILTLPISDFGFGIFDGLLVRARLPGKRNKSEILVALLRLRQRQHKITNLKSKIVSLKFTFEHLVVMIVLS
jgi:hypothetical protein